jgi:hypothetical protein
VFGFKKKSKKDKKKAQLAKNRHLMILRQLADLNQENVEREDVSIGAPKIAKEKRNRDKPKTAKEEAQETWSGKLQEVRNKNTGHRRAAEDRWNRLAGTSGAGGRSR